MVSLAIASSPSPPIAFQALQELRILCIDSASSIQQTAHPNISLVVEATTSPPARRTKLVCFACFTSKLKRIASLPDLSLPIKYFLARTVGIYFPWQLFLLKSVVVSPQSHSLQQCPPPPALHGLRQSSCNRTHINYNCRPVCPDRPLMGAHIRITTLAPPCVAVPPPIMCFYLQDSSQPTPYTPPNVAAAHWIVSTYTFSLLTTAQGEVELLLGEVEGFNLSG